jgi:hypothetical protein
MWKMSIEKLIPVPGGSCAVIRKGMDVTVTVEAGRSNVFVVERQYSNLQLSNTL